MTVDKIVKFINMTDQLVKFKYKSGKFEFDEKIGGEKSELKMTD